MPLYNFQCKKCNHIYEELVKHDKSGKYPAVKCPECDSKSKIKLMSLPATAIFKNPEGCDKWCNSHEYRAKYRAEEGKELRSKAEKASHVGNPYKNDPTAGDEDIQSGKYFGEVK